MVANVLEKLEAAETEIPKVEAPKVAPVAMRRFALPDLDVHGAWVLKRLLEAYPHLHQFHAAAWLRGLLYNNEVCFLFQPNAVGLFQLERNHTLAPFPLVRERFVWAREPKFIEEASWMYVEADRWAKQIGAETMLVCEGLTDVAVAMIRARLNQRRVFVREQQFVKVGEKG